MRDTFLLNFSDGVIETGNKQVVCYKVWLWHNCWFQNVMTIVEYRQNQILIWFLLNSLHYAISPATGNKISVENEGSVEMQSGAELSFSTFSNRPKVVLIIQYFTDDRKKHNIVFFFFFTFPFRFILCPHFFLPRLLTETIQVFELHYDSDSTVLCLLQLFYFSVLGLIFVS